MNKKLFLTEQEYFNYFEQFYSDTFFSSKYPLVCEEMKDICIEIKKKIKQINSDNYFKTHSEILALDSRMQIILSLINLSELSEQDIVNFSKNDYKYYFTELCGFNIRDKIPCSLYFSIK